MWNWCANLNVKSAGETHVLICPVFGNIRILWILLMGGLDAGKDEWNELWSIYNLHILLTEINFWWIFLVVLPVSWPSKPL
jgi:hypothetical protein